MNSRVCYFGLAKARLALRYRAGWQMEGQGRYQKPNRLPFPLLPALSQHTKTDWRHSMCGKLASWFFCVLKIKISACLFFGGQREPHQFPRGGFSGEERVLSPVPVPCSAWPHTRPFSGSGLHVPRRRNCISTSTVKGWLWSRELREGPGYMASGPGGSLKSLAADTSLLMCLSSVMPASWRQVWDREGTWPSVLNPASVRALVYMGRPMETSQSDTDETHPGERGFLQISVSPPLGIWIKKESNFIKTWHRLLEGSLYT